MIFHRKVTQKYRIFKFNIFAKLNKFIKFAIKIDNMPFEHSLAFAQNLDSQDFLAAFANQFHIPTQENGQKFLYFTGNSLGLQPVQARTLLNEELDNWAKWGVEGHVRGNRPWVSYHEQLTKGLAYLTGALESEVVAMNSLTVNLHLLMVSFYKPSGKRKKILIEHKAFPSDIYAVQSQIQFHGGNPETDLLTLPTTDGFAWVSTEQILETIEKNKDEIALLLLGAVNYYSGQVFDIEKITKFAQERDIVVGWDLAHAMGNIPLQLHDWNVDFAAWCGYKYLNGGPGAISGIFVHENHLNNPELNRFEGWWGTNKKERFKMADQFDAIPTAEAWQCSNPPIFAMTPLIASLELFMQAGKEKLSEKSSKLTGFLRFLLSSNPNIEILTPESTVGCQLSLRMKANGKKIFDSLEPNGIIADWREPDVIRVAPVPLYNSFTDVWYLSEALKTLTL